ncbi:Processing alpha glucosidase I [Lithohypha guttulata]|uniref:Processing alpha glucosidase I n=1 Tax=Lithohypha guttulata TaxID=1690604 RepID=UPI002DE07920|nr:Processing alpha glucosidase I [Lithohypha guttulata]
MRVQGVVLSFLQSTVLVAAQEAQSILGSVPSNDSLLWGPYRPNLYFGVRPRIPKSLLTGLMWTNVDDFAKAQENFRHTCEQHAGMAGYGWEEYDTRHGGREVIHDAGNKIDLTIDFVKMPGGSNGGSWAARVKGSRQADAPPNLVTTVLFYAGMEGIGELGFTHGSDTNGVSGPVTIHGSTTELGDFDIEFIDGPDNRLPYKVHPSWDDKPLDVTLTQSFMVPPDQMWRSKEIAWSGFKQTIDELVKEYSQDNMAPPWQAFTIQNDVRPGNMHIVQKVFVGNFEFDVLFKSASGPEVSQETLSEAVTSVSESFKKKFGEVFQPAKPFDDDDYRACSESMLSNLAGGIGYFYGDSLVDRSYASEYDEEDEGFWEAAAEARSRNEPRQDPAAELYTAIPSRPFFPRGFLWDEGFHLIPIVEWDTDLALQIIESWFKLMDEDGWIAREQILGPEARSKVPAEFQVQYPHYANPTTLFLIVEALSNKVLDKSVSSSERSNIKTRLETLYPRLQKHYEWYRRTQAGDIKSYDREAFSTKEGYRWRGRTPRHILPSGLDDYPRAQPPHPGELHLDLLSWIGLMSRSLVTISTMLDNKDDVQTYTKHLTAIIRNLDDLHWSSHQKAYCDATIDDYDEHMLVCHKGYISLFPLMLDLLPHDHKNIPAIIDLLADPDQLWSPFGIRSLSKKDELYGTDENYWRSPVWMNMNYLIVKSLHTLASDETSPNAASKKTRERAAKTYSELRKNLVNNVMKQWKETGFAWEQYSPETGAGQRTQHFTGWTSLVVSIMAMDDLPGSAKVHEEL